MKPFDELARTKTPDGAEIVLLQHCDDFYIEIDGATLMSTRSPGSERALAELAIERMPHSKAPRLLIGGLGLGFTLGAALDLLPRRVTVVVAEVLAPVVDWNRKFGFESEKDRLADPRVTLEMRDVVTVLNEAALPFDAIMLDVDNGPDSYTLASNDRLYTTGGLANIRSKLTPGGVIAVWSAEASPRFERRLRKAGFEAEAKTVRSHGRKGSRHTILLGRLPGGRSRTH